MLRATTLLVALSFTLALPASAQFGSLGRKAKEKAQQAISGQPAAGTPKFDNTILELNERVMNQVLAGLRVRANTKDASGRNAGQLRTRAGEMDEERNRLNQDRENDRFEFNNKLGEANNCMQDVLNNLGQQHANALQRKIMGMTGANLQGQQSADYKFMQEYTRLGQEQAAAMAAGDTLKFKKLQAEYNKLLGVDPKADSAKARAQCNPPAPPPWMARADMLADSSVKLYAVARDLEQKSNEAAIRASGLTAEQFMMAVERLDGYMGSSYGGARNDQYVYTAVERKAMEAHRAELQSIGGFTR